MNFNLGQIIQSNPVLVQAAKDWARKNPQEAARLFQTAAPEVYRDLEALCTVIGRAATPEQKKFMAANTTTLLAFLDSKDGQEAISMTLDAWQQQVEKKAP